MCGIVGAVATRNVVPILIEGLKRLEYRGYDSAGVAVREGRPSSNAQRVRAPAASPRSRSWPARRSLAGTIGIAHTRWATHGVPTERNAHPHVRGGISVVHNGIIENHEEMRAAPAPRGYDFTSETDTEVIAHLVHFFRNAERTLLEAVRAPRRELKGAYAIAVIPRTIPAAWWWRATARRCCWAWATARTSPPPTPPRCCR